MAKILGWDQSKISRIENGQQLLKTEEVEAWADATGSQSQKPLLRALLDTTDDRFREQARQRRVKLAAVQKTVALRTASTRRFRIYEPLMIPGILQTPDYARAVFAKSLLRSSTPEDVDDAVAVRMERQRLLHDSSRRFHILIGEGALLSWHGSVKVMLAQLTWLIHASYLPTVRLGVIPAAAPYTGGALHGFWIDDDVRVSVDTLAIGLNLTLPHEIDAHVVSFEALSGIAQYGDGARQAIEQARGRLQQLPAAHLHGAAVCDPASSTINLRPPNLRSSPFAQRGGATVAAFHAFAHPTK